MGNVNNVDVNRINDDVDRLLKHFSEKLSKFNFEDESFFIVRKDFLREVKIKEDKENSSVEDKKNKNFNGFSKKVMFSNAPFSSEDYILAEKKKW